MLLAIHEAFAALIPVLVIFGGLAVLIIGGVIAAQWQNWTLRGRLARHFRGRLNAASVVTREFLVLDLPNLQPAISLFVEQHSALQQVVTVQLLDLTNLTYPHAKFAPPQYRDIDIDIDRQESFLVNGLYLLTVDQRPLAILVHEKSGYINGNWGTSGFQMQVLASTKEQAAECINALRKLLREVSIYRGKIISLEKDLVGHDQSGYSQIRFHEVPRVAQDQIILPRDIMQIIERNTIRFFQKSALLKAAGQSIKRGLLLYGPPGTGKTWTARWLTHSLPNVTVILVTGEQLWNIKESCRLARSLSPAMVILEDVDLIALSRETTLHTTPLHELMNEMDGLDSDCEVLFLLTTNRPDALEPALAARPGRIDQAILFPLPDGECRQRLLKLYGQGLDLQLREVPDLVKRTDGASPAFIKELVRKAALIATDDHQEGQPRLAVTDAHFDTALREMTRGDSDLTGKLLGFTELMI